MDPEGRKIKEYPKILYNMSNTPFKYIILSFKNFLGIHQSVTKVKGSLKSSSGCYESIFGSIILRNLAFPATIAAFLTFVALKHKNNDTK